MLDAGWCLNEISMLRRNCSVVSQYYYSSYTPPRGRTDHLRCSEYECLEETIDEPAYRQMRCQADCNCAYIDSPSGEMVSILQAEGIPLLKFSDTSHSHLGASTYTRYVAISHVWSHGLGNTTSNSLRRCQLSKIQSAVNSLYGAEDAPMSFWIDTLCIPIPDELRYARTLAIRKMNKIYSNADKVIVLDADIGRASIHSTWIEQFARISMSRWYRRLWRLAEGALARNLCFKLSDGSQELDLWANRTFTIDILNMPPELVLSISHVEEQVSVRENGTRSEKPEQKFLGVVTAIQYRDTTKAENERLCMASLNGLDPSMNPIHKHECASSINFWVRFLAGFYSKLRPGSLERGTVGAWEGLDVVQVYLSGRHRPDVAWKCGCISGGKDAGICGHDADVGKRVRRGDVVHSMNTITVQAGLSPTYNSK